MVNFSKYHLIYKELKIKYFMKRIILILFVIFGLLFSGCVENESDEYFEHNYGSPISNQNNVNSKKIVNTQPKQVNSNKKEIFVKRYIKTRAS